MAGNGLEWLQAGASAHRAKSVNPPLYHLLDLMLGEILFEQCGIVWCSNIGI